MRYITTTKNLLNPIPVKPDTLINSDGTEEYAPGYDVYNKIYGNNFTISVNAPIDLSYGNNYVRVYSYNSAGVFITRKDFNLGKSPIIQVADNNIAYIQICITREVVPSYKLQIELGPTATPYVPYGYLPMYKGKYKVSDVCQLLDKSKYLNNDGYINNGNGTITTKSIPQDYMRIYDDFDIDGSVPTPKELSIAYRTYGHKVLILDSGNNSPGGGLKWEINSTSLNAGTSFAGQGEIFTNNKLPLKDIMRSYFYIVNPSGYTFTCAPQLFDLTEMFGAGNEPTTVEEFKQKFPNDLYPYSPYCWAKIKSLIYKDNIDYIKMK